MMRKWLIPLLICGAIAPFTPAIDLAVARHFFEEGHFLDNGFTRFLYKWGEIAGFVFGSGVCGVLALSFLKERWKKWRKPALCLLVTLVLGAGILINGLFKEHWGRPRPKQLVEFGGEHQFRPFYAPDFHTQVPQKSFPSGHVAMGVYYLALCLVARRLNNRPLFVVGAVLTLFWGGGLFFARIAQGGHFFSDALFSLLFMWLVALASDAVVFRRPEVPQENERHKQLPQ